MGVRGLTGYIARHAELYLLPYELHDCNLVIDGDSLSCNLYTGITGITSTFGGDYDTFYRAVVNFFQVLAECNIEPYVLMDGGYESRKLHTVGKRLRGKISVIKKVNPTENRTVFPVLMKEVFVDAARDCGAAVMRCIFEADDELATLSRKLGCPVLTYDSDFYIYNVQYIPLITLTIKAHTKRLTEKDETNEDHLAGRILRKNEAKHVEKLTKSNRIISEIKVNNMEKNAPKKGNTYKFLDCCIYRIEHLIARRSLSKEKLPLFAALLGNDYIARSRFRNLFATGMGKVGRSRKIQRQQKRILVILRWLKEQTVESARTQILCRLPKAQRKSLKAQMYAAVHGYSNEKCLSYDYFVSNYENAFERYPPKQQGDDNENEAEAIESECEDDFIVEEEGEEEDGAEEEADEDIDDEDSADATSSAEEDSLDAEEGEKSNIEEVNADEDASHALEDDESDSANSGSGNEDEDDSDDEQHGRGKLSKFPNWFLNKLYPAHLPRYFVNLIHLRKYINSPQIEHFPYNDCNEIALPILIYSFTLLHKGIIEERGPQKFHLEFTYMARRARVTNIHYTRYAMLEDDAVANMKFTPTQKDPLLFEHVFRNGMPHLNPDKLFVAIQQLPKDLQMYFLAIVYWLHKSQHCDIIHLHALLISVVVLRTIDTKIPVVRNERDFKKRFSKILKTERTVRDKEALQGITRRIGENMLKLSIPARMAHVPKSDCYLVMNELLKHFHMQEIFKKKFDNYSTTILHAFAEFQSIVFQLYGLNGLLDMPFEPTQMGKLYCGVFIYNMYDLLKTRVDIKYHVKNFIFRDSQRMYDFYEYLLEWCDEFVPHWKRPAAEAAKQAVSKKTLKKKRQAARKKAAAAAPPSADPNAELVDKSDVGGEEGVAEKEEQFFDMNNKFCEFLAV